MQSFRCLTALACVAEFSISLVLLPTSFVLHSASVGDTVGVVDFHSTFLRDAADVVGVSLVLTFLAAVAA